jgi:hypothetical protein
MRLREMWGPRNAARGWLWGWLVGSCGAGAVGWLRSRAQDATLGLAGARCQERRDQSQLSEAAFSHITVAARKRGLPHTDRPIPAHELHSPNLSCMRCAASTQWRATLQSMIQHHADSAAASQGGQLPPFSRGHCTVE